MIDFLDLSDERALASLLSLQRRAYQIEAELLGVLDLPPLLETAEELRACGEKILAVRTPVGDVVGALGYTVDAGTVEIARLMVHPDFFRQGLGSRLVVSVMCKELESTAMRVSTGAGNTPALALYHSLRFSVTATRWVRPGLRIVTLMRSLP